MCCFFCFRPSCVFRVRAGWVLLFACRGCSWMFLLSYVLSCLLLTVPGCRMAPVAPLGSTRPVFTFPASSWLALGCSWIFLRGTHDLLGNQFRWAILLIFSIGHIVCQLNSLNNIASLMSTNLQPYRSPEGRLPIDVALLSCTSYIICVVNLYILSMVRTKVTKLC